MPNFSKRMFAGADAPKLGMPIGDAVKPDVTIPADGGPGFHGDAGPDCLGKNGFAVPGRLGIEEFP
jgi:hypothetical protein